MTDEKKPTEVKPGCMILFALPFATVGVVTGWIAFSTILDWRECSSWRETPCTITAAKLVVNNGGDSTTYKATAQYRYTYNGLQHTGDRVGLSFGSDNLGSWQQDKGRELKAALKAGGAFRCFVDPDAPQRAILYPEIRGFSTCAMGAFSFLFGSVGFGLMFGARSMSKKSKHLVKASQERPDEPWTWRSDWESHVVSASNWKAALTSGLFALFWNTISWTAAGAFLMSDDAWREWWLLLVVGAFPTIGLCLTISAIYQWRQYRIVAASKFQMASVPGVIGGYLSGAIRIDRQLKPPRGFLVTLTCLHTVVRKTSDGNSTSQKPFWQKDKRIVEVLDDAEGLTVIPVQFAIPDNARPTSMADERTYSWQLEAYADVPGVDYLATFEVPVFHVESLESRSAPNKDDELADFEAPILLTDVMARSGIRVVEDSTSDSHSGDVRGSVELYFPPTRNALSKVAGSAFAMVWSMIAVGLCLSEVPGLLKIIFSGTAVLILFATTYVWLNSQRLNYAPGDLSFSKGVFFRRVRRIDVNDISRIVVKDSGFISGNTHYQQVEAVTTGKDRHVLASGFARLADAFHLAESISHVTGKPMKHRSK